MITGQQRFPTPSMPKLLRAVRLDDSDEHVFRGCGAARDGEWVVTGGHAVCDFDTAPRCDPPCHCGASFVAVRPGPLASLPGVAGGGGDRVDMAGAERC